MTAESFCAQLGGHNRRYRGSIVVLHSSLIDLTAKRGRFP